MQKIITALDRLQEAFQVRNKWRTLEKIEKDFRRELSRFFDKQGELYEKELERFKLRIDSMSEGLLLESDADDINDHVSRNVERDSEGLLKEITSGAVSLAYEEGGKAVMRDMGMEIPFSVHNHRAVKYIDERSAQMVTRVSNTTRKRIRTVLSDGIHQKKSYQAIAKDIRDRFKEFGSLKPQGHIKDRAELVAITELGEAFEESGVEVMDELKKRGLKMEKAWQSSDDAAVSDGCQENQDAGWIDSDDTFPSGHDRPLRFPGCRCTMLKRRKRG